jgi:fructokinase
MIATFGEALIDMIEQPSGVFMPALGGSIANFSVAAALQGVPVTYLNALSTDRFGQRFVTWMQDAGVLGLAGELARSDAPTSIAIVMTDENGKPDYAFHREQVADRSLNAAQLISKFPTSMKLIHTGCLALVEQDIDQTLAVLRKAHSHGALVSVDANLRPAVAKGKHYIESVKLALAIADCIKVSDDDAALLGMVGTAEEIAEHLFSSSRAQLIAVTLGSKGAHVFTRSTKAQGSVALTTPVIDTVGAGDCFWAALLCWLYRQTQLADLSVLSGNTLNLALEHAMKAAAISVQRAGCQPASWEELVSIDTFTHLRVL